MKTMLLLLIASLAQATCPKNCIEWQGNCACDAPRASVPSVEPSNEKPRRGQQPEWETGEVKVINAPSLQSQDLAEDKANAEADFAGKKAAGLIN